MAKAASESSSYAGFLVLIMTLQKELKELEGKFSEARASIQQVTY